MTNNIIVTVDEKKAVDLFKGLDEQKGREFIEVVKRAYKEKPSPKDLQELRQWLDQHPELWRVVFDISYVIEHNLIKRIVSESAAQLALEKNVDNMRHSLGFETSSTTERLLIDGIVLSWLRWQWTEYQLVLSMGQEQIRMSVIDFWEKRLGAAQHRYLKACESLTKIRHLISAKPAVQVNIASNGGQQVNVTGDVLKK